jgi:ATP-binding cassette subfamily F protein uup
MPIVRLDQVSLSYGLKPLLNRVDLQVRRGERVCLLGRNGEGKSSLLRLISRESVPDSGEVWVRPGARVASLAQEVAAASEASVAEIVRGGAAAPEDWEAELAVDQVIARLGLDAQAAISTLSGGWRRRTMLGRALVTAPDLLLLDEPTNHLDIDAITWLEEMMLEFSGALLFISHDRAFVRRLATRIVELDRGTLRVWPGGYDDYVVQKRAALEVEAKPGFVRVSRRVGPVTKAASGLSNSCASIAASDVIGSVRSRCACRTQRSPASWSSRPSA